VFGREYECCRRVFLSRISLHWQLGTPPALPAQCSCEEGLFRKLVPICPSFAPSHDCFPAHLALSCQRCLFRGPCVLAASGSCVLARQAFHKSMSVMSDQPSCWSVWQAECVRVRVFVCSCPSPPFPLAHIVEQKMEGLLASDSNAPMPQPQLAQPGVQSFLFYP